MVRGDEDEYIWSDLGRTLPTAKGSEHLEGAREVKLFKLSPNTRFEVRGESKKSTVKLTWSELCSIVASCVELTELQLRAVASKFCLFCRRASYFSPCTRCVCSLFTPCN